MIRTAVILLGLAVALPSPTSGQDVQALADACVTSGGDSPACLAVSVAARTVVGQTGLLAGLGSGVPGEGSTLGTRISGTPRIAPWVRFGGLSIATPDLSDASGAAERSSFTPALSAGLAFGVFEGFQLLPTVGGFLSVDVTGELAFLYLSEGAGYEARANVLSFGGRVGILRESFTLPGVTVSLSRRISSEVRLSDGSDLLVDPSATSLRVAIAKDLYALGLLGGFGWDGYDSDATIGVSGTSGAAGADGTLESSRRLWFVGVSKQVGILAWIAVEGGWAQGLGEVAGYTGNAFDPDGGTLFGSASLLLKF